jgi:peptide-methionine (S)-S-oxide reductase
VTKKTEQAIFAGGCFWGMEDLFRHLAGVIDTEVGYTGGSTDKPVYKTVKTGSTGHAEALQISFDPTAISYRQLLKVFFRIHDPTTVDRQGNDRGSQYRSAIFYLDESQKAAAEKAIADANASGLWPGPIVTEVTRAGPFWPAEPEHQDYLQHYPMGYTCHFPRPGWNLPE